MITVRVGPHVYVVETASLPPDLDGRVWAHLKLIQISDRFPPRSRLWRETVIHELQHAYYHHTGHAEPDHTAIAGIAQVVVDNQRLLQE